MTEDEMVGWHHQLNGREFEQTPGDGGQGSLPRCSPRDSQESSPTSQFKNINSSLYVVFSLFLSLRYFPNFHTYFVEL